MFQSGVLCITLTQSPTFRFHLLAKTATVVFINFCRTVPELQRGKNHFLLRLEPVPLGAQTSFSPSPNRSRCSNQFLSKLEPVPLGQFLSGHEPVPFSTRTSFSRGLNQFLSGHRPVPVRARISFSRACLASPFFCSFSSWIVVCLDVRNEPIRKRFYCKHQHDIHSSNISTKIKSGEIFRLPLHCRDPHHPYGANRQLRGRVFIHRIH